MLTREVVVTVYGDPKPKGSMKCVGARGGRGHQLVEDNKGTAGWRELLGRYLGKIEQRAEKGQAVGVSATFTLPRVKAHHVAGDLTRELKASAPRWPVSHSTGDTDKLLRLLLDAVQDAPVLPDDCAVVEAQAVKVYPDDPGVDALDRPGVRLRIYPVERS